MNDAQAAAANLRAELITAGILHDPTGMTDTDIQHIVDAAQQLHTATGGNTWDLIHAVTNH
ncbi:hypothetical protein OG384_04455 [Streptomyces sp. NBC_01324]|uniref:hypothetical protein n=1 Tax=Streptomyces sp. NBC_01324 TaxID=2903826 RepID=UPI002E140378|nr:hypothetical protein OG384_04455 [Streptomyces sp. NBC_01324]